MLISARNLSAEDLQTCLWEAERQVEQGNGLKPIPAYLCLTWEAFYWQLKVEDTLRKGLNHETFFAHVTEARANQG